MKSKWFAGLILGTAAVAGMGYWSDSSVSGAPPKKTAEVDHEANLAKVPAKDPAPAGAPPQVVAAMKGVHPRLLFTTKEIETLKKEAETDPILKNAAENVTGFAKRFKLPKEATPVIVTNDQDALVKSMGNYVGMAYGYALEKDPKAKKNIIDILTMMLEQPYWADVPELDSSMGAGNNMFMVAMLYDTVHDDLDPALREKLAEKILLQSRRMFYLGHKELNLTKNKYWQQDTQNNHRWHRDAGLSACLLSIADEKGLETGYLLEELKKEMDFVMKWYPADGDCHEGAGYHTFGFMYLETAARMMDRVLGTEYLKHPGFQNAWAQEIYYWAPGRAGDQSFGDDMNGSGGGGFSNLETGFFVSPHLSRDKDVQAALLHWFDMKMAAADKAKGATYHWGLLENYDPTVGKGDYKTLPTNHIFADLGAASVRDSWEPTAVLLTFKCGPYGGYKLNEFAHAVPGKDGKLPRYINVAHDDPDANGFALGSDGDFFFHPGVYSLNKMTSDQTTILIDGKGQNGEGTSYMQPVKGGVDMRTISYLTGWKADKAGHVIVEGETGKAYSNAQRFRRSAIYMPGEYILVLDDVRTNGKHKIEWHGTVSNGKIDDAATGECTLIGESGKTMGFQMLANQKFESSFSPLKLEGRFKNIEAHQFSFSLDGDAAKFACVIDAWKAKPQVTMKEDGDVVTLTVKSSKFEDVWTWTGAKDDQTPSSLVCKRDGKEIASLTTSDKAPHGDEKVAAAN